MSRRRDEDLAREIQTHIELEAEQRIAEGLSPGEAQLAARRGFGNITLAREDVRAVWIPVWIEQVVQDVRYTIRMLRGNRGFAAAVIATLAIGIGGTTTIFSVFDAVLIRPLPYAEPERLYAIHESAPKLTSLASRLPVNAVHFLEWQASQRSFEQLAMLGAVRVNLTSVGEPELVQAARVTPALFAMLGAKPAIGRLLTADDDRPGHDHVVLLEYGFWQARFNGDAGVVGRSIVLDGLPFEVVGVLSEAFTFPDISHLYAMTMASQRPRLWKPFALQEGERAPLGDFNYSAIGRLRPTVSLAAAQAEFDALQAHIGQDLVPGGLELHAAIVPLVDQIGGRARTGLQLLLAAGALVSLIVCINVSNLLLARGTARRQELAVRGALGASSRRLVRQALVESGVLSAIGGTVGFLIVL